MSFLYWIYDESCSHPDHHGYVGVSEDPSARYDWLRSIGRIPADSKLRYLFEGPREECFELEQRLRSERRIGWNIARGGMAPKGKIYRRKLLASGGILSKDWTPERWAQQFKDFWPDFQIFFCYSSADRLRFARFREQLRTI
jgi:hypothetical protein